MLGFAEFERFGNAWGFARIYYDFIRFNTYLPTYLATYLATYLPSYLPTYLPTYLPS